MQSFWNLAMLGAESQRVIFLRLTRFAFGGPFAHYEANLMVSEKVNASLEAATQIVKGAHPDDLIVIYRRKVRENYLRLVQ